MDARDVAAGILKAASWLSMACGIFAAPFYAFEHGEWMLAALVFVSSFVGWASFYTLGHVAQALK